MREYDFLDFRNEKFNLDFQDFNRKVSIRILSIQQHCCKVTQFRESLKKKLESTYSDIWDTPHAFQYLARWPDWAPPGKVLIASQVCKAC